MDIRLYAEVLLWRARAPPLRRLDPSQRPASRARVGPAGQRYMCLRPHTTETLQAQCYILTYIGSELRLYACNCKILIRKWYAYVCVHTHTHIYVHIYTYIYSHRAMVHLSCIRARGSHVCPTLQAIGKLFMLAPTIGKTLRKRVQLHFCTPAWPQRVVRIDILVAAQQLEFRKPE